MKRPFAVTALAFLAGTKGDHGTAKILEWTIDPQDEAGYASQMRERVAALVQRVSSLARDGAYTASTAASCFFCRFQTMCSRYPQGAPVFPTADRRTSEAVPDRVPQEVAP